MEKENGMQKKYLILIIAFGVTAGGLSLSALEQGNSAGSSASTEAIRIRRDFRIATPGTAVAVSWSADGSALAVASNYGGDLTVWDKSGKRIGQMKRVGGGPALSGSIGLTHNASQVLFLPPQDSANTSALSIWDVQTGKIIGAIAGPRPDLDSYAENRADHFSLTADQKTLIGGARLGGGIVIYNVDDWSLRAKLKLNCLITSVSTSHDGQLAAIGCSGGRITIINMNDGLIEKEIPVYDEKGFGAIFVENICWSADDKSLFASGRTIAINGPYVEDHDAIAYLDSIDPVVVINLESGERSASLPATLVKARVSAAGCDPKGRYVAFVDQSGALFLWKPTQASDGYRKIGVTVPNISLSISPDGDRIAVSTGSGVSIFSIE